METVRLTDRIDWFKSVKIFINYFLYKIFEIGLSAVSFYIATVQIVRSAGGLQHGIIAKGPAVAMIFSSLFHYLIAGILSYDVFQRLESFPNISRWMFPLTIGIIIANIDIAVEVGANDTLSQYVSALWLGLGLTLFGFQLHSLEME